MTWRFRFWLYRKLWDFAVYHVCPKGAREWIIAHDLREHDKLKDRFG